MKKIKIILSSVALLMVLVFCLTMGVYAATSATFKITSSVSFQSPDIQGLTIECYVDHADLGTIKQFTYSTDENVESDGDMWDLHTVKNSKGETIGLTYSERDENDHYAPITLRFVIKHKTGLNIYAYFTKPASEQDTVGTYIHSETLIGTKIVGEGEEATTLPLIDATMNDEIETGIPTKPAEGEYNGGEVSIEMALKPDTALFEHTVNFKYNLIVSKFPPTIETPAQ